MVSCTTVPSIMETPLEAFPIEPPLEAYTVPPVISKEGDRYTVTSQFVSNSVLLKEYNDRIREWRGRYNVK